MKADYYETYWTDEGFKPDGNMWPELCALYARLLPDTARVLDLGCGDGGTSGPWLVRSGYQYVGADVSPTGLRIAADRGLKVQQLQIDEQLPFADDTFDAVVCIEVLEHLFALLDFVIEARRVLKPGGIFICTTPNFSYWRTRVNMLFGYFNPLGDNLSVSEPWRDPHIRFFTPKSMTAMLTKAGFRDVTVEGQRGGMLNDMPYVGRRRGVRRASVPYRTLERTRPSLFGYCLAAYARG